MLGRDEHLLFQPISDAEGLLGREVTKNSDGTWTLAEELAPGCRVRVREAPDRWKSEQREDLGNVASFSAGLANIAALKAHYGTALRVHSLVTNTKVLTADFDGPCGTNVVKRVKVGTGERRFERQKEVRGGVRGGVESVELDAEAVEWEVVEGSLVWEEEQAWAIGYGPVEPWPEGEPSVYMPQHIVDGQRCEVKVTSTRPAWLIALYREADGHVGILLPSMRDQTPFVRPVPPHLPSAFELVLSLRNPAVAAHEKLLLFWIYDEAEFRQLRPPGGVVQQVEADEYLLRLEQTLQRTSSRHWDRRDIGYVIEPKGS